MKYLVSILKLTTSIICCKVSPKERLTGTDSFCFTISTVYLKSNGYLKYTNTKARKKLDAIACKIIFVGVTTFRITKSNHAFPYIGGTAFLIYDFSSTVTFKKISQFVKESLPPVFYKCVKIYCNSEVYIWEVYKWVTQ